VALLGPDNKITAFAQRHHLRQSATLTAFAEHLNVAAAGLCEAVVPPSSQLVGRDFKELHMRDRYGTQVLAVYGGNKVRRGQEIQELNLRAGDTLCMFCRWPVLADLAKSPDVVVATTDYPREKFYTAKAHMALGFTLLALILVLSTNLPVSVCLLSGAVGMIFSGVLSIDQAYAAVSWKTVFLLAGLIPLGYAVQYTGAATWLAEIILQDFDYLPYWGLEIVLAVAATLFSLVMTNIGATVLLVPIAVQLATQTHSDPRIFALIVAISTSNSFLIPTHQANALVAGPGHYKTSDFIRAGSLMSILYIVITLIGVNLIFLGD
jgi:di/tricarboxylate transporter